MAADDSDLERTEPASSRRLEQAREEGNVPQSRELTAFMVLAAGVGGLWALGGWLSERTTALMKHGLNVSREAVFDPHFMFNTFITQAIDALTTLAPFFLLTIVATIAAPISIGGFIVSPNALQFNFQRLDPLQGMKRLFSVNGLAEMVKAILKALLVGFVIYWVLRNRRDELFGLMSMPVDLGVPQFMHNVLLSALLIVGGVALIAAIDVPFQLWQYYSKLRMTKEELRQEGKETEGNPEVKGQIRRQQREMAKRRMMTEVPKADVVVTNPTHYAVALKYDSDKMAAPQVVAKGMNLVAAAIRELAAEHNVPILEAPPLARALYRHADLGAQIPSALYTAVAEVMAYVYQLSQFIGGRTDMLPPQAPTHIAVPADMDPGSPDELVAA